MYSIQLENNTSFEQYQMAVKVLEAMGIGIKKNSREDFYYELSEEDLKILAISEKESELGEVKSHKKVSEGIRKYRTEKWK